MQEGTGNLREPPNAGEVAQRMAQIREGRKALHDQKYDKHNRLRKPAPGQMEPKPLGRNVRFADHQQDSAGGPRLEDAPASPRNPPAPAQFDPQHHVAPSRVGQNIANIFCQLRNIVRVAFGGMKQEMHANTIHFNRPPAKPGAAPRSVPIAGQSPQSFEHCEKFLMHGFDSNRGLFQFVGPDAVSKAGDLRMESAIAQLKHAMQESGDAGVTLGGRYYVRNVKQVSNGGGDQQCFRITADDLENPGTKRTLYVTLAGLPFDGIALKARQIERADALLARQAVLERRSGSSARGDDPMVLSYGGYGRNAALICYREAVARLDEVHSMSEVARLLQQIVDDGRRDRGPHFIHSQEQYDALYDAVCAKFAKKKSKAREEATNLDDAATARRQGFAARVGSKMVSAGRRFFGMSNDA